ncbi:LRR and PYD domains-containing 3-like protein [Labeo rohita]|uniref:LRR and PYD domains-containing 3-like protein n=1 Tax=Labeo rohita TaxID=84645 RepID=A0A498M5R4_LABRO|nr:LRR and PYD domains-containing 3-like protein [Labeo rohita]
MLWSRLGFSPEEARVGRGVLGDAWHFGLSGGRDMGPRALWSEIRERHGPGAGRRRVEIIFRRGSLSLRQEEAVKITVGILRKMNQKKMAEQLENKHKKAQTESNTNTSVPVRADTGQTSSK